jgi:hypothetical protein
MTANFFTASLALSYNTSPLPGLPKVLAHEKDIVNELLPGATGNLLVTRFV